MRTRLFFLMFLFVVFGVQAQDGCEGDITLSTQSDIDNFKNHYGCNEIAGDLIIEGDTTEEIVNLLGLSEITSIGGNLSIKSNFKLTSLAGLNNLRTVGIGVTIWYTRSLESLEGLNNLTTAGSLAILGNDALTSIEALSNLTSVDTSLRVERNPMLASLAGLEGVTSVIRLDIVQNASLISLTGLDGLTTVIGGVGGSQIIIEENASLTSLAGLGSLGFVGANLSISGNASLTSLAGLEGLRTIDGALIVSDQPALTSIEALAGVTSAAQLSITSNPALTSLSGLEGIPVARDVTILSNSSLTSLTGLEGVTIGGDLWIGSNAGLTSLAGLEGLVSVGEDLEISRNPVLGSLEALESLTTVNGQLKMSGNASLTSLEGLENLTSLGSLSIRETSLISLNGLDGLTTINILEIVDNPLLTSLEGLAGVTSIGDQVYISGNTALASLDGLENVTAVTNYLYILNNASLSDCACGLAGLISGTPPGFANVGTGNIGGFDPVSIENNAPDGQCTSPEVVLETPCQGSLQLTVSTPSPDVGEKFNATISVRSAGGEPRIYSFEEPLLSVKDEGILDISPVEPPEPFELGPGDAVRKFVVPIVATNAGLTEISSTVSVMHSDGSTVMETATQPVLAAPFDISVVTTPRQLVLNQTPDSSKSPGCDGLTHEDGSEVANCIEIKASIENATRQTIENITIPQATNALSLLTSRDLENPGVPLTPIAFIPPAGTSEDPLPFTLEPGEMATFTWYLDAYDAPADLDIKALMLGSIDGKNIQGLGQGRLKLIDKVLLQWGIRPQNGKTDYLSGQLARAEGFIKNVSKEGGEARTLRVMVYQLPEGNLGGGFMFETGTREGSSTPDYYQIFDLPPEGNRSELNLTGLFRSFLTHKPSGGVVRYDVRLWVVEDDGSVTSADDQTLLDDAWLDEFPVHFAADPPPPDTFKDECLDAGVPAWLCGMSQGIYFQFTPGIYGLLQFAGSGFVELYNLGPEIRSHNVWLVDSLWHAVQGDPAAQFALAQELYVEYQTYVELGVMAGKAGSQLPLSLDEFAVEVSSSLGNFFKAIDEGDLKEVQFRVGEFFGANPDMLLEPFIVARGYQKMARALREAGKDVGENVLLQAERQASARQAESLESRLAEAEADPNVVDLATVLKAGDELSDDLLRRIYGLSVEQRKALQKFCRDNDVIIAFRSRHPRALELLEANEAWPKPQALKWKTVNDIDVEFLGYRSDSLAKIEVVEPPAGIAGKTGDELTGAIDAYMDALQGKYPKLKENPVLVAEVRARLRVRADEWNDLAPKLNLETVRSETEIGVNFGAADQFTEDVGRSVGVKDTRTVFQKPVEGGVIDPVTGTSKRTWEISMSGPNGGEARAVVGDIDILAILEPNGGLIRDAAKRIKLYHQLAALLDMQHGESFVFRLQNYRVEWLRCCTVGGEAMVTIGPGARQTPTAGYFVDNLSVLDNGPNAEFMGPRPKLTDDAGNVVFREGQPVEIRRPDPTGEFVLIDGMPAQTSIDLEFFNRFIPLAYSQALKDFFKRAPFYLPSYIARLLGVGNQGGGQIQGNSSDGLSAQSNDEVAAVFSIDGPILQAGNINAGDIGSGLASLRVWTESEGWQAISATDALALGAAATADLAPMTSMPNGADAGATLIEITPQTELGAGGRFFEAGDIVVLNPGGGNQETAIVAAADLASLWLAEALRYDHESGEMVAWVGISETSGQSPTLTIALVSDPPMLELTWPAAFADFALVSTTDLGSSDSWTPMPPLSISEQDGNLVALIERPEQTRFFRLVSQ